MKLSGIVIGLVIAVLTACGGGGMGSSVSTTTPTKTIQATILALESSRNLPALDRSAGIAGPDENVNSIRDDVDAYIARQGYTAPQLKSVQQIAKAMADILVANISSQDALKASDLSLQKSIKCVYLRFSDSEPIQPHTVAKNIEKLTVNTKVRAEVYMKYQIAMNGKVLASPQGNTCE